jgi:hypothetical protein
LRLPAIKMSAFNAPSHGSSNRQSVVCKIPCTYKCSLTSARHAIARPGIEGGPKLDPLDDVAVFYCNKVKSNSEHVVKPYSCKHSFGNGMGVRLLRQGLICDCGESAVEINVHPAKCTWNIALFSNTD